MTGKKFNSNTSKAIDYGTENKKNYLFVVRGIEHVDFSTEKVWTTTNKKNWTAWPIYTTTQTPTIQYDTIRYTLLQCTLQMAHFLLIKIILQLAIKITKTKLNNETKKKWRKIRNQEQHSIQRPLLYSWLYFVFIRMKRLEARRDWPQLWICALFAVSQYVRDCVWCGSFRDHFDLRLFIFVLEKRERKIPLLCFQCDMTIIFVLFYSIVFSFWTILVSSWNQMGWKINEN